MIGRVALAIVAVAAGVAVATFVPGLSQSLRNAVGLASGRGATQLQETAANAPERRTPRKEPDEDKPALVRLTQDQITAARIDLTTVRGGMLARSITVPGTVVPHADRIARVSVRLSAIVAELRKKIGDPVAKDEILAILESREVADAKSEYLAARLTNDLQQDLSARDKTLWDSRAGTEQQYLRSRNAAAQTGMRLNIARQKLLALGLGEKEIGALPEAPEALLRLQDIRSPIAGRVAERKVELGTAVGRDNLETELFVVVDLSRVWVELSVASSDLPLMKEGQAARITSRASSKTANGKIIFVSPLVDKDTRTARVVAEIDNADGSWRPGSFVTATIALDERDVAVVAPAAAIQSTGGEKIVFVRTKDGFDRRSVVPGQRDDQAVEIVSGLTAGETVAASNTFSLKAELSKPRDEN